MPREHNPLEGLLGGSLEGYRKFKSSTDFRSELSKIMQVPLNDCSYNAVVERIDSFCFDCAIHENSSSLAVIRKRLKRIEKATDNFRKVLREELTGCSAADGDNESQCVVYGQRLAFDMLISTYLDTGTEKNLCLNQLYKDVSRLSRAVRRSQSEVNNPAYEHNVQNAFDGLIYELVSVSEREGFPVSSRKDDGSSGKASPFVELVWCCLHAAKESRGVARFLHSKGGLANRVSTSLKRLREKKAGLKNQI